MMSVGLRSRNVNAGEYANLPLIPPYLEHGNHYEYDHGANFASGGGGALPMTYEGWAIGLQTQMEYFKTVEKSIRKKLGNERSKRFLSNSVFLFSFGGEDYLDRIDMSSDVFKTIEAQEQFVNMVIRSITMGIKEVHKHGGRKFGVLGVPPLGFLPSSRLRKNAQFFQVISSIARIHNRLLPIALDKLSEELEGFKYSFADVHTALLQRILHPELYGFENVATACCGSGDFRAVYNCGRDFGSRNYTHCENLEDHVFFDAYHPTQKVYKQLAEKFWSGDYEYVRPLNFEQLFHYDDTTLASY